MPLVSMNEILAGAQKGGYAVGCFNSIDLSMARGIISAAEEEGAPVILCHAETHFKYTPLESVMPILRNEAEHASVPVTLLLDHGKDFGAMVRSLHLGMNAVMYDGSELEYAQNIQNTKEIVRIAHALGASVEGEIGRVVRPADAGAEGKDDAGLVGDASLYTDPDEAADFVKQTGIDALACAFGTVHGVYRKEPKLDFSRLRRIAEAAGIPIVMHGGSGLSQADFQTAIANGVRKINYYTNLSLYMGRYIQSKICGLDEPFYHHITVWTQKAVCDDTRRVIRIFMNK